MFITKYRKIFVSIGAVSVILSVIFLAIFGLKFGPDFTGGAVTEVSYEKVAPGLALLKDDINALNIGNYTIQPLGEKNVLVRTKFLEEGVKDELHSIFLKEAGAKIERFNATGPVISKELTKKSLIAIFVISLSTIIFIAFVFRGVSEPVSSWKYGLVAIITLVHDIVIPTGIFAILGKIGSVEIDILFVTALLSILGISINDTIVIFDRIRENLKENKEHHIREEFDLVVGRSLSETFARSFNTSFTALIVLLTLYFLGGESIKYFMLAMTIGMVAGVYSSLFIAAPLLVLMNRKTLQS
ncbi:MAG: protein translocase subunit SecF [Patescibacteria group bacterium]